MKVELLTEPTVDVLIVATFQDQDTDSFRRADTRLGGALTRIRKAKEFEGKRKELKTVYSEHAPHRAVILVGLGNRRNVEPWLLIEAVELAVRKARKEGFRDIGLAAEALPGMAVETVVGRMAEAAVVTARVFDRYLSDKSTQRLVSRICIVAKVDPACTAAFRRAVIVAEAVNRVRDLQDTTAEDLYPASFAAEAKRLAQQRGLQCTVWDERELQKRGYNAILAVGRGSVRKPRLITLEYVPKTAGSSRGKRGIRTVCLVGKGITFDSGGYNLKPTGSLEDMKNDMAGAAVVFGVMEAAARLRLPVRIIGILGCAENMVSGEAYRPSDIIKTASGITVEVGNTDAEGRLVLADCLFHAQQFKPDATIDLATLTGACVVALGTVCAGVLGNNQELVGALISHGERMGERLWQLPLFPLYDDDLESKIADVKSTGYKREGGTITAALFLQRFVGEMRWAHIDIAGTAYVDRPRHCTESGGTGWGVRLLVDWLSH